MALRGQEDTETRESGKNKLFEIHGPVFWPSVILITALIVGTLLAGEAAEEVFNAVRVGITDWASWLFVIAVNLFIGFALYFAFSRFGAIRIGGEGAEPEFTNLAWFAMLFSAGMGIGLMFFAVAEPMWHLLYPPHAEAGSTESVRDAMGLTFLHWGLHAWAIYAIVGLALAFFAFNRDLPLSFRSVFYPLLGERINGWMGDVIDILAVLATLFGLATSLGIGASQAGAGMEYVFGLENTVTLQVIIIVVVTGIAVVSVVLGIDKGVKVLSEFNIRLAGLFLLFILVFGPTLYILGSFVQNTGYYIQNFASYATWTQIYEDGEFMTTWTVFYWAWWIAWAPFVGTFIARVSRGRTIRNFVIGVMLVPVLVSMVWFAVFGGAALESVTRVLETTGEHGYIYNQVFEDEALGFFALLQEFPLSSLLVAVATFSVAIFFITSSDSGTYVNGMLTSGGNPNPPVFLRITWGVLEGAIAAVLLYTGGEAALGSLQTASVVGGFPFMIIMALMLYCLIKALNQERAAGSLPLEKARINTALEELKQEKGKF